MRFNAAFAVFALILCAGPASAVESYPWVPIHSGDLQVMTTAKMDLQTRLALIRGARNTIDVAVYEQKADAFVGLPILSALRDAADRGVKIRFLTSWVAQAVKDRGKHAERYLLDPPTREPIQVIIFGGKAGRARGFSYDDAVHEKVLLVDGETLLATGRGHSDSYLNWLDTSFVVRGPMVAQVTQAMNALWETAREEMGLFKPKLKAGETPAVAVKYEVLPEMQVEQGDQLRTPELSVSGKARVLHFDMLRQFVDLGRKLRGNLFERATQFDDPVINAMIEKIATAKEVRFTTLSVIVNPKLKQALIAAADRGASVTIQTNGPRSALDPFNVPWKASLGDVYDLLSHPNIEIYGMDPGPGTPWTYLHRKLAIVDDAVIFGSHNLNLPSSVTNDEMSFEVEDSEFAQVMRDQFDEDMMISSIPINRAAVHRLMKRSFLLRWMANPFLGFF